MKLIDKQFLESLENEQDFKPNFQDGWETEVQVQPLWEM